jgi:predicted metalloprotease with PDZ domain
MDPFDHGTRASRSAKAGHTAPHTYCAPDYDTLVDSPILIGNPELYEFSVDGVPHVLANAGDTTFFDSSRVVKDLEAIVRATRSSGARFPISATSSSTS